MFAVDTLWGMKAFPELVSLVHFQSMGTDLYGILKS